MKDLLFLAISTLLTIIIWRGIGVTQFSNKNQIPKDLLDKTIPISGTIDVEFVKNLDVPAYEQ
jgi:hypothetical protein